MRCQTRQAGPTEGSELLIEGGTFSPIEGVRLPARHGDRGSEPLLQHPRAPGVSQVGHDREPGMSRRCSPGSRWRTRRST